MESMLILGNDLEDLIELIKNQKQYNTKIDTNVLYEEIVTQLEKYEGKIIISNLKHTINPTSIDKTDNFQFLLDGIYVSIANKYF